MSFRVLHPGLFSLVVDGGRPGHRRLGLPLSGPADRAAFEIGNAILGNPSNAPAIEITLTGPTLQTTRCTQFCVFGAPFAIMVNGEAIPPGICFEVPLGDILRIGGTACGARAYLCVAGGIDTPLIAGSRSALKPLEAGMLVTSAETADQRQRGVTAASSADLVEAAQSPSTLRVLPGPQSDWFLGEDWTRGSFQVLPASNRMGIRLQGIPLARRGGELVSEAVGPGAVQVTNDGQLIILGVDGQTIGGYPKIAHVIRADLDRLGQLRPGAFVRFQCVTMEEAERLGAAYDQQLTHWLKRLALDP